MPSFKDVTHAIFCAFALALFVHSVVLTPAVIVESCPSRDQASLWWAPFQLPDEFYMKVYVGRREDLSKDLYTIAHKLDTSAGILKWTPDHMKHVLANENVPLSDLYMCFTIVKKQWKRHIIQHVVAVDRAHREERDLTGILWIDLSAFRRLFQCI